MSQFHMIFARKIFSRNGRGNFSPAPRLLRLCECESSTEVGENVRWSRENYGGRTPRSRFIFQRHDVKLRHWILYTETHGRGHLHTAARGDLLVAYVSATRTVRYTIPAARSLLQDRPRGTYCWSLLTSFCRGLKTKVHEPKR